ncbi:hypothetical protein ACTHGU_08675 [Chitinophagaceae bacterium MMS25-I14]
MPNRQLFILCLLLAGSFQTKAQQHTATSLANERMYARKPLWINMMEDTMANYFEVKKAFTIYFEHHEQPEGEEDEINEYRERQKIPSKRKQRKITAENILRMQVKHYYSWLNETLPYVQDDGRILTPSERLSIWKAQQAPAR